MIHCAKDFGPFEGKIWLNVASEGPLPRPAVEALKQAAEWKAKPYELTLERFSSSLLDLKKTLGRLIHVPYAEIIAGNSATFGIHLLANGLPLEHGDEILCMQNDFPTNILPWLGLTAKGVVVHQIPPKNHLLQPSEIIPYIKRKTKVLCLSHVHTFSGYRLDVEAVGKLCRERGIIFVLNISQSAGAFPVDISALGVDAVTSAGYKWLCGPYATGFCWMKSEIRSSLEYNQAYWSALLKEEALRSTGPLALPQEKSSRRYDVFAPANFFNFIPWRAAIEYLIAVGLTEIEQHNRQLVDILVEGLDKKQFYFVSPASTGDRTNIVVFSHRQSDKNPRILETLKKQGIYLALWKGNLRAAPHLYNTSQDIEKLLTCIHQDCI